MRATLFITLLVSLGLIATLVIVREPGRWPAPEPLPYQGEAADVAQHTHSAAALSRLIREPQNTWSNLAFVVGGALLVSTCRTRLARAQGIPLLAVGMGSFLYHASAATRLRELDVGAMYWLFLSAAVYCVSVLLPRWQTTLEARAFAAMVASLVVAALVLSARNITLLGFKPLSLTAATVLGAGVVLLTLAETARRKESVSAALQLLGIVTLFGVAAWFQISDRPGRSLYRPAAVVQAHAVWHVLAAISFAWAIAVLDRHGARAEGSGSKA